MDDTTRVPILRYEPTSLRGEPLAPRGSVVVYLAAAGSDGLATVREVAHRGVDAASLLQGTDAVDEDGHRVTVRYAGRTLAAEVPVPLDGRAVRLVLPFTGGELDAEALTVEASGAVEAVAVRHDPPLTAIEQAALTLLPRDQLSVNLGAALPGGIAGDNEEERRRQEEENRRAAEEARNERAAAQAEAQAEAAEARAEARREARQQGGEAWASRIDIHLLDATVKTLTSVQAASAMLEIRRELLRDRQVHG